VSVSRCSAAALTLLLGVLGACGPVFAQTGQLLSITTPSNLPEIVLGSPVSATFAATGGVPPYTWSAMGLPSGFSLNATTGALSAVPTQPAVYTFAVVVTDSATPTSSESEAVIVPVFGITTPSPLPGAVAGRAYSMLFGSAGGLAQGQFSSPNLPAGLAFSGAILSGVPTAAGTFTFPVSDEDGSGIVTSATFKLTVAPALSVSSSGTPGEIAFGSYVTGTVAAIGDKPPYTWSASGLPHGVTLNTSSGALGGSPSQPGNYSFTVQVSDSESPPSTQNLTISLQVPGFTTPSALPAGSTMTAYSQVFSASGGTGPFTFTSPNAPSGLNFNGATLSGTPSTVGSYGFTVVASDANGFAVSSAFTLIVTGPASPLSIAGGALSGGIAGNPYSQNLTGTGGNPPDTWSVIGGALPPGLSLTGPGGISGTPSAPGSYVFTAQATDGSNTSSFGVFTVNIAPQPLTLAGFPFPNGIAGSDYPIQILTGSGGVGPYTFALASGSLPPGLSLTNGAIGGIASSSGTFNFSLSMTDSENPPLTTSAPAQIVIAPQGANLILSAGSLSFSLATGAADVPAPAIVTVESSAVQTPLQYSIAVTPSVSWLDVKGGGTTPGGIVVALDPSAAILGALSTPLTTGIVVTCLAPSSCAGMSQTVAVSLLVSSPTPLLAFNVNLVQFSPGASTQQVSIQNIGGGSAAIDSVSAADPWLTVSGVPVSVQAGAPVGLTFTANPSGLAAGFYRTVVTIQSSAGTTSVPVTLEVANAPTLILSAAGAQFPSTLGSPPVNTAGTFLVGASSGTAVHWTASVLAGASWLSLNQFSTSGTASLSTPGLVDYTVNAGVATQAQTYYGVIQIVAPGAVNSPLNYVVVLNVAASTALPVPYLQPAGLLFPSKFAGASSTQNVTVYSSSGNSSVWSAFATTTDGSSWLSVSPASGMSFSGSAAVVSKVSVNPGTLPVGVYTGTVSYQFSAATVRSVNVTMVVSAASGCVSTQVAAAQTGLTSSFAQAVGWPAPISLTVVDNCGFAVTNGQVVATFSNGDPPLTLFVNQGTGVYSGTWTPLAASGQVTVTATMTAPGLSQAKITVTGEVLPNAVPLLTPGGTLHVYNPLVGAALGQGTILQIYGSNLSAGAPAVATAVPLPTMLGGTTVTIGGIAAPLYYVSAGQIDAQLPYELTPGKTYQVIVNSGGAMSMPISIVVAAVTPGVAAFASGLVVAQHPNGALVSESSPAAPGEYVVIYLSGLGVTNHPVADGAAAPNTPLSNPVVAPVLTQNGVVIPTSFAGLTPGEVGLYQINFQVPANTPNGDALLVISQSGTADNPALLPVHK